MKNDNHENLLENLAKLQWACRRGMLELDVLLGNFLKEAYPGLSLDDKKHFIALLECTDPELFAWLLGQESPTDTQFAKMTDMIRRHARSRV